jgi:hypothetical protein
MSAGEKRALSVRQARTCEEALEHVCKCRCGGALHGAARGSTKAFFESLPETDAHFIPSAAAKRARRAAENEAKWKARLDAIVSARAAPIAFHSESYFSVVPQRAQTFVVTDVQRDRTPEELTPEQAERRRARLAKLKTMKP